MKTLFLCRDGAVARYVAHELAGCGHLSALVVESGREARRRKLRREWARTPWWKAPSLALDLTALALYGRLWVRALRRRLAAHSALRGYPDGVPLTRVDDANSETCIAAIREHAADVVVVLGTSILGEAVLSAAGDTILNIHGGIVPEYRNVHSEVWAVLNDDLDKVGTSILHLDAGIDSGAVALQDRVENAQGFFDLRWRNVVLAARLINDALDRAEHGSLPRRPQDEAKRGFYATPGAGALLRLAVKRVSR